MAESLPSSPLYVTSSLRSLFKSTLEQLMTDLGQTVTLYMPSTPSGCPNCKDSFDGGSLGEYDNANPFTAGGQYNKQFPTGGICPVCQNTNKIWLSPKTVNYTALITRRPKDIDYDEIGASPEHVFKTKTVGTSYEDIFGAEKAKIETFMCVRLQEPIKTGLKDRNFVQAYWKKIE